MAVPFYLAFAALWLLVIFNSLVVVGLVRERHMSGPVAARGAPAASAGEYNPDNLTGQPVPAFAVEDVLGRAFDVADLAGAPAALLFVSPDCSTCGVTLEELEALKGRMDGKVVVVCRSIADRCRELARRYELSVAVLADEREEISELFRVVGTPTAVLIDADGRVGSYGHPMSGEALEQQMDSTQLQVTAPATTNGTTVSGGAQ